jgi:cobalt-zinc-cadmium efflux system membrane fusion protein
MNTSHLPWRVLVPAAAGLLVAAVTVVFQVDGSEPSVRAAARPAVRPTGGFAVAIDAARAAGITIAVAAPARIATTVMLYGAIKPNAEREQDVRARYPGVVRAVAKRAGDSVSAGEILVRVESNESLRAYGIRSPISGRVLERAANPGESVGSETVLMTIADLNSVWAEFAVFAHDVARIRPGLAVRVRDSNSSTTADAELIYVAPSGSADSQSVVARAVLDNRGGKWIAGQFASAEVVVAQTDAAVAVVPTAIQLIDGKEIVFVETNGRLVPRPVRTGRHSAAAVEVLSGLAAGERYAAVNSYLIKADLAKGESEEE